MIVFPSETSETVDNDIEFANYHWDDTVGMYYLNARWYDPVILRFTGRDPVDGDQIDPLTLHVYLYCLNNPVNSIDPTGEIALNIASGLIRGAEVYALGAAMLMTSIELQDTNRRASDILWTVGDWTLRLTPVAAAYGLMNPIQLGGPRTVSHWPGVGKTTLEHGNWVMSGPKNRLGYLLSGKWQQGGSNIFAGYGTGKNFLLEQGMRARWPGGVNFWKGFLGQRVISIP